VKIRIAVSALALVVAGSVGASAETTPAVATERVNFNIGCQQSGENPTCESTEYWLGTGVGTNSVASLLDATPLGWAFYQLEGGYSTTTFAGDATLRDAYSLVGGSVIKGQIVLSGFAGGAEVGVDSGVFVRLVGTTIDAAGKRRVVDIGQAEVTKIVSTPIDTTYAFEIPVAETLDGTAVSGLSADVGQRHVTVLQNGFMDGEGGSWFDLPYYEPVEQTPAA